MSGSVLHAKVMRWVVILVLQAVFCAGSLTAQKITVIHVGRLIDTSDKKVRTHVSIVVTGDKITALQEGFVSPAGAEVVDLSNASVLPGLIDCHKHLTMHNSSPSYFEDLVTESSVDTAFWAVVNSRITLMQGFTSVRNVGAGGNVDISLKRAINKGLIPGPRVWAAGEIIGPTGGHSDYETGLAPGVTNPEWKSSVADGPQQVQVAVRERHRDGADLIKIVPSGGVGSIGDNPKLQLMSNEEIKSCIDTAHALGMKVAAHAHGKEAIDNAVRLGVDSIEHGTYADAESLQLMKEHGTYLVPTIYIPRMLMETATNHPEKLPPNIIAKIKGITPVIQAMYTNAVRSGVKIAFGTDSFGNFRQGPPARELEEMVRLGMSPMDALAAATSNAADLIGVSDQIGSLGPGHYADIIAVTGDPLQDIAEMEKVQFVMKGGIVYKANGREVVQEAEK